MINVRTTYGEEALIWLQVEPREGPWRRGALLPSPEATEELPINPFRSVGHPMRLSEQLQHILSHEGEFCIAMLLQMLRHNAEP